MKIPAIIPASFVLVMMMVFTVLGGQWMHGALHGGESAALVVFFHISLLFVASFFVTAVSRWIPVPSFVLALLFGLVTGDTFLLLTENQQGLSAIVALGATLILFGGGLEVPYRNFRRLLPKILILSLVGLLVTAFLTSVAAEQIGSLFGVSLAFPVVILLGVILASTDPAAIIPALRTLQLYNRDVKHLIISESAVTDVTGTVLIIVFLGLLLAGEGGSLLGMYGLLGTTSVIMLLLTEVVLACSLEPWDFSFSSFSEGFALRRGWMMLRI